MPFIFMDESGDLGFDFSRKGTSRYFLITLLFCERKRPIEKCVKKVHRGLCRKYRRVGSLHAYREEPATRKRPLRLLACRDCKVMTILLNKHKVYTRLQDEKAVLYNYVTNILLDRIFSKRLLPGIEDYEIIAARRETNRFLNANFRSYLQMQLTEKHDVKV